MKCVQQLRKLAEMSKIVRFSIQGKFYRARVRIISSSKYIEAACGAFPSLTFPRYWRGTIQTTSFVALGACE